MEEKVWVILNYTLPKDPSRVRVSVWRKLKKIGSVNIGQSMWVLPFTKEHFDFFSEILNDVQQNQGEGYLLDANFIGNQNSENIIQLFNKASDQDYKEVLEKCADFFQEIKDETAKENFTYAEVEENEYEYNKLIDWYNNVLKRDFFNAPLRATTEQQLNKCKILLEEFSGKVYDKDNE